MGGGMRQAGYLAAAGLYALEHQVIRLKEDHEHAQMLASALASVPYVTQIKPVQTNIVIFDLAPSVQPAAYLAYLAEHEVKASAFGPQTIRMVTHLDVNRAMIAHTVDVVERYGSKI
jgi:threonine aldolase